MANVIKDAGPQRGFHDLCLILAQLVQKELKLELPSSDYPKRTGCVSPSVILTVNEQIDTQYNERDKYVPEMLQSRLVVNQRLTIHHMPPIGQITCTLQGSSLEMNTNFQGLL